MFYGFGSLHLSHAGEHLGIHWAWGKKIIQQLLPRIYGTDIETLSGNYMEWWWSLFATFAPLDGYGDTVVDTADFSSWLKHLEGDENDVMYSVRLHRCPVFVFIPALCPSHSHTRARLRVRRSWTCSGARESQ